MTYNILGLIMLLSVPVWLIWFIVAISADILSKTSEMWWNTFFLSLIVFVILYVCYL